jgi:hypothetical protein
LESLPVDRLRFEYEKRAREVDNAQSQYNNLERRYEQIQQEWGDELQELQSRHGARAGINMFDASGFQNASKITMDDMSRASYRVSELKDEMAAIEKVLNSKWR